MLQLYSRDDKILTINDPFRELWSILKFRGKYILLPEQTEQIIKKIPKQTIIVGKLCKDKKFYFDNISDDINIFGNEIQLSIDYDYEIQWEIKSTCKNKINVGFYSPYRKFSFDRLYLNFDKNNNELTKYKCHMGKILINCHILVLALDKYHSDTEIILTINPIIKKMNKLSCHQLEYCNVKIFDIKKEGMFYRPLIKKEFKKLYNLVRKYYEFTSIERSNHQNISKYIYESLPNSKLPNSKCPLESLPKEIDYIGVLSKKSYESIFTVTSNIQPISDRIGYYGIIIKRDPNIISSATIYYEFELSDILQTPDVIVAAAYYEGDKGYVLHQIYDKIKNEDVYVMNIHNGPYSNNNIITGQLDLESTAVDITLIIGNSLYGILPTNGRDPNKIVQFKKFDIQYNNIER
jgi:hypothetical protein